MGGGLLGLFFLVLLAGSIVGLVFWILKLVEVAGIPDYQFRVAGTEKLTWVLVVALAGWIGALIWHLARRPAVLAAAGAIPPAPAGWYHDQTTFSWRFWDGSRWV